MRSLVEIRAEDPTWRPGDNHQVWPGGYDMAYWIQNTPGSLTLLCANCAQKRLDMGIALPEQVFVEETDTWEDCGFCQDCRAFITGMF